MKKVFFLTALLCASVMSFAAIDWNSINFLGDGAGDGAYGNKYKVAVGEGQSVVNIQKPDWAAEAGIFTTFPAGINSCSLGDGKYATQGTGMVLYLSAFTQKETEVTVVHGTGTCVFTVFYVDGESSSSGKADPELSINESTVTLDVAGPKTFQIVATRQGTGAISYSSNNPGIASVDDTGLVTAVGRGTARITVTVAEDENYEEAAISLQVTVNGPINWNAVSWLGNGTGDEAYTDKYKAVSSPSGMTINNLQSNAEKKCIHVICPSAEFGACSLEASDYHAEGAGLFLHLDAFTAQETQFTLVCGGTTYTFDVYNANSTATAVDNVTSEGQAMKVLENGQLVIIRNGMRYNAAGQYLK